MMDVVNLESKFSQIFDHWQPRIVGELNGQEVKLAKLKGEFIWHVHEDADELFLIVKGSLTMRLRDREVQLNEGDLFVVPRGIEHLPIAEEECHVLLFEPAGTVNTGSARNDRTILEPERL